jgi:hypothetical protein
MVLTSMFVTKNVAFNLDLFIMVVFSCKDYILITKNIFWLGFSFLITNCNWTPVSNVVANVKFSS